MLSAMPIVSLEPKTKQKIEAELNASIPLPHEEAFEGFAGALRLSHPDLHRELILGLQVESKMPIEQEALKAKRRHRLRAVLNKWFYQTRWPNDRVLDKRRLVLTALLGLMGVLSGVYWLRSLSTDDLSKPPLRANDTTLLTTEEPRDTFSTSYAFKQPLFEAEDRAEPAELDQAPEAATLDIPLTPANPAAIPLPKSYTPFPKEAVPQPVNVPANPKTPIMSEPSMPQTKNADLSTLPKTLAIIQEGQTARALEVWALPKGLSANAMTTQALPQADSSPLLAFTAPQEASSPLTISTTERSQPTNEALSVMQSEPPAKEPGAVFTPAQEEQALSVLSEPTGSSPLTIFSQSLDPGKPSMTIQTSKAQAEKINPTGQTFAETSSIKLENVSSLLKVGTRLPAVLKAGLALTEGVRMPVIAETKGNGCGATTCVTLTWLGQAELSASGRVELSFSELVIEDEVLPISAVALGKDDALGLAISTEILASEVAHMLLQSAAGGVSDYLNALINQQKITLKDNTLIQEGQVPGIEAFLVNRIAQLIAAPSLESENTRVARLEKETEITLLIRD